ncbi:MAG: PKD domain-containing protein [Isosphaeraceae bacterium]
MSPSHPQVHSRFRPTAESLEGRALPSVAAPFAGSANLQRAGALVAKAASPPTIANPADAKVSGALVMLSVLGRDASGEKLLTYTWSVASMPAGAPAPTFSSNGTNGAKRTTATLGASGVYRFNVTVTDRDGQSARSTVRVSVASKATRLAIDPSSIEVVVGGKQLFNAAVVDQFGRPMGRAGSVTWQASVGTIAKTGLYSAPSRPATAVISARSGSLSGTASIPIVPSNTAPVIGSVSFQGLGATSATLVAAALDDGGASNLTYAWSTIARPDGAPDPRFDSNGASSTRVEFGRAGAYRFAVSVADGGGLSSTGTVDLFVSPAMTSVVVVPDAVQLAPGQAQHFDAAALDQFGRPMPAQPAFTWSSSAGRVDASGNYTSPETDADVVVTATAWGLGGTGRAITRNEAPSIASISRDGDGPVLGTTVALHAIARDDGGASGLTYAWSMAATPDGSPSPTFSGDGPDISATFGQAGAYSIRLTVRDRGGLSAASAIQVVVAQAVRSIDLSPHVVSLSPGGTQAFAATLLDQFGRSMPTAGISWSATSGSIDSDGHYTATGGAPSATVAAEVAGLRAESTVLMNNSAPTITGVAGADRPIGGTAATLVAQAVDDGGPENLVYSWLVTGSPAGAPAPIFSENRSHTARSTVVSFGQAGTYTFSLTAIDQGGLGASTSVSLTVAPTLSAIAVAPGDAAIKVGRNLAFSATGLDQFGGPMTLAGPAWSARTGSIGPDGIYLATAAGDDTVMASVGPVSGTATAHAQADIAPQLNSPGVSANPAIVAGSTTTLAALASDADDVESSLIYTWSVIASPAGAPMPTFSINGNNAAKSSVVTFARAGSYTFALSAADPQGLQATSTVQVIVSATATSLSISPSTVTLVVGQSQGFAAAALDQFGQSIASPTIDWFASTGSIGANGLFTVGSSSSTGIVTARFGALAATASILPNFGLTQPAILGAFSADFADGRIDRNDMIGLLNSAGLDGAVGQGDLNDLRAILNASSTYQIPGFVQSLASSVVNGSVANAHYQGATLGNLSAGSPASMLTKLIDKWFLGSDHPDPSVAYLNATPTYAYATGVLFQSGPSAGDMKQGQVGDCYLIATLGSIARSNPTAIANMIADNGDHTYTVRFFADGSPEYVTVDRYLPVDSYGRLVFANMGASASSGSGELWMPLIEKAYAQWYETGVYAPNNSGRNAYASIDSGYLDAVENHLIGAPSSQWEWYGSYSSKAAQIIARLNQPGVALTAGTSSSPGGGLVGSHAYVIQSYDASTGLFLLVNPWGSSYPTVSLTISQMNQWIVDIVAQDTTSSVAF